MSAVWGKMGVSQNQQLQRFDSSLNSGEHHNLQ